MARLNGVDLPRNKRIHIALTYIFGVGPKVAADLIKAANISNVTRVKDLSEQELVSLRELLKKYMTEGELRRQNQLSIRRLSEIGSYRGTRHKKSLPARGQRTHTNARTRRGKKVAVAGKKKVTK